MVEIRPIHANVFTKTSSVGDPTASSATCASPNLISSASSSLLLRLRPPSRSSLRVKMVFGLFPVLPTVCSAEATHLPQSGQTSLAVPPGPLSLQYFPLEAPGL